MLFKFWRWLNEKRFTKAEIACWLLVAGIALSPAYQMDGGANAPDYHREGST